MFTKENYISKVEEFVSELLCELPDELCYHNLKHTREVVAACKLIAQKTGLNSTDTEIVIISAWFHDAGHISTYFGHEQVSADIAKNFLNDIQYPTKQIAKVQDCILATKYPQKPKNELQRILCDADMFHLTFEDYEKRSFNLKEELETVTDKEIPHLEWCFQNFDFMKEHCYFTRYGKSILHCLKEKNMKKYFKCHCQLEENR
jgi:HD superfamily phosphodiesterase